MNVKRTVKKILALGAGVTMIGATVMGATAYNFADYPAGIVTDGVFSGKIVVGEKAATNDVLGAIDIAASLQAESVVSEQVEIPGAAGEVSLSGDTFKIGSSTDKFEMREKVGNVYDTFDENDLDALKGGSITTDEGDTDFKQYLRLEVLSGGVNQLVDWGVNYVENDDDEVGDYMVITRQGAGGTTRGFFEWELEFSDGLESSVDSTGDLQDIENEVFNIFGTDYTFVDSNFPLAATTTYPTTLDFMAGDVGSTLREGETKTFTIDGVEYEVTLIFVSDPSSSGGTVEAKFMVNGEVTKSLQDGETDTLSGGMQIGIRDILVNSRDGVAEFFLGANKIRFYDKTTNAESFDGTVEVANEKIEDGEVAIRTNPITEATPGTVAANNVYEITSIKYRLKADAASKTDLYIPAGEGLKQYLDEPQGMLSPTFDIRYEGLTTPEKKDFKIYSRSDNQYYMEFTNIRGYTFDFPFFSIDESTGTVQFGDEDTTNNDDFVFAENNTAYNIGLDDYFVVSSTDTGTVDKKSVSTIFQLTDVDTSEHRITLDDLSGGENPVKYDATTFNGTLTVSGHSFKVSLDPTTNNTIRVDLNGDGTMGAGTNVDITVWGGPVLDIASADKVYYNSTLSNSTTSGAFVGNGDHGAVVSDTTGWKLNMSMTTDQSLYDETGTNEMLKWQVVAKYDGSSYLVDLNTGDSASWATIKSDNSTADWGKYQLKKPKDVDDHYYGMTTYGIFVDKYNPTGSSDPNELTLSIPEEEVLAQVFLTAGSTSVSGNDGSVTTEKVNPFAVGIAVLDVNAPEVGSENMIVVGGPCANTVAAELLGNPENCAEGFEPGKAMIKSFEENGKVAILVAGYEAQETLGASYVLASHEDYDAFTGSEVEVAVPDLSSIVVNSLA